MRELLSRQKNEEYILNNYSRYKRAHLIDQTTWQTSLDILEWMRRQDDFKDVVYAGERGIGDRKSYKQEIGQEGINKLVDRLYKDLNRIHRKESFKRSLNFLTQDMFLYKLEKGQVDVLAMEELFSKVKLIS